MTQALHVLPDHSRQRQVWAGEGFSHGYITSGGLFTVPGGGGLTLSAQACEAYVYDQQTDELLYCGQSAMPVGPLNQGNGTYWVIIHRDLVTALIGWARQTGTRYLWQPSATRPVLPSGTQLLAKVIVSGGAITDVVDYRVPASLTRCGVYDVTDELYGAVPDGTTDAYAACLEAIGGMSQGGVLFFPQGSYALTNHLHIPWSGVHVRGAGMAATILTATGGVTSVRGLIHLGNDINDVVTNASDQSVSHMTIDGNSLCRPIQGNTVTRAHIHDVRCLYSSRAAAQFFSCVDLVVEHCHLEQTRAADQYGDGLYLESCSRPKILHNVVYDFTRIGIVCEGSPGATCDDVLIEGNTIHYGHDNQFPEHNAGIWVEHTDGAIVVNNHCFNLTNTSAPGADSRGIMLAGLTDTNSTFTVTGNKVRDATRGINIEVDTGDTAFVCDNTIQGVYDYGILLTSGGIWTHVEGNFFEGDSIIGVIAISAAGANVGEVYIGPNGKGVMTYSSAPVADLLVFDFGTMPTLTIEGLVNWKANFTTLPTIMKIRNCSLLFDNADVLNFGMGATNSLLVSDSSFGTISGTLHLSHQCLRGSQGAYYTFNNCTFQNILGSIAYDHVDGMTCEFFSCNFTNSMFFTDGAGHIFVRDSQIYSYNANGMFRGNDLVGYLEVHVSDCWIVNAADTKCFVKLAHDPDVFVLRDVTYNNTVIATNLYDWTPNNGVHTTVTVP